MLWPPLFVWYLQHIQAVVSAIVANQTLLVLDVSGNDLNYGARDLVSVLSRNTTLKTLALGSDLDPTFMAVSPTPIVRLKFQL